MQRYRPSSNAIELMEKAIKKHDKKKPEELISVLEEIKKKDMSLIFLKPQLHFKHHNTRYRE